MSKLTILQGLPASGKSTHAAELLAADGNTVRVNRDELRLMLYGPDFRWSGAKERLAKNVQREIVTTALFEGKNVIVDDTNLLGAGAQGWVDWARNRDSNIKCEVVSFTDVPILTCIQRDAQRTGRARVGAPVIYRMALEAGMIDLSTNPNGVAIFDLDGTLANLDHRLPYIQQTPKDYVSFYGNVFSDGLFPSVRERLVGLYQQGTTIIILSGRPSSLLEYLPAEPGHYTMCWLHTNNIPYHYVFMRRGGDHRPDVDAKREIWNTMVERGKLTPAHVKVVYDDRDSICALWKEIGLPLVKVDHDRVVEACGISLVEVYQP